MVQTNFKKLKTHLKINSRGRIYSMERNDAIVVGAEVVQPPDRVPSNPQIRGGYRKSLDQASGKHYYFNAETRKTQWETPDEWK